MSFMKDLFIEAYDDIMSEAEENGTPISKNDAGKLAHKRSMDNFFSMCDAAKDRRKYSQ